MCRSEKEGEKRKEEKKSEVFNTSLKAEKKTLLMAEKNMGEREVSTVAWESQSQLNLPPRICTPLGTAEVTRVVR